MPSAGPYYVASYMPLQRIVLKRNPSYGGRRPRRLKEIRLTLSVAQAQSVAEVEAGRADYALEVPRDAHAQLSARYGPGSEVAKAGRQQYFVNPELRVELPRAERAPTPVRGRPPAQGGEPRRRSPRAGAERRLRARRAGRPLPPAGHARLRGPGASTRTRRTSTRRGGSHEGEAEPRCSTRAISSPASSWRRS